MLNRPKTDIIFILIGVLPIVISYHLHPEGLVHELLKDFGVVIVSLALVDLLWQLVGGEPLSNEIEQMRNLNRLTRQAQENGLVDLAWKRSALTDEGTMSSIKRARHSIDLCSYSLHVLVANRRFLHDLLDQVKHNVKVRLLICAPDNPTLRNSISPELLGVATEQMDSSWKIFQGERNKLSPNEQANFEVRQLRGCAMLASVLRYDDRLYALSYLLSKDTSESPVFAVKGSDKPLFSTYAAEFDHYFALGEAK